MADVALTNYEINQQAYRNIAALSNETIEKDMHFILNWITYKKPTYLGILCRDKHDYTLIHTNQKYKNTIQEMQEVIESRGEIVDIMHIASEDVYQIWVRERHTQSIGELEETVPNFKWTPQHWMYMIFDATDWVVEA